MTENFSGDTQRQIRELAAEIVGSRAADGPVGRELQDHIEDKILAYLDGLERVTEADALYLARKHFGNREKILAELAEIHGPLPRPSLIKKIIPCFFAYLAGSAASSLLALPFAYWMPVPLNLAMFYVVFRTLQRWRARELAGHSLRFASWPVTAQLALLFLLLLIPILADVLRFALLNGYGVGFPNSVTIGSVWAGRALIAAIGAHLILTCIMVLWWCAVPRNDFRGALNAIAGFTLLMAFSGLVPAALQRGPLAEDFNGTVLFRVQDWGIVVSANPQAYVLPIAAIMIIMGASAIPGWLLYNRFLAPPSEAQPSLAGQDMHPL
ncbi:MAG: hypothetical protein HYV27_15880 [Candidatus Hydrogenedentes bacterium]|nr:hypothetical protein [Candidatus Hydrogenedentota bacterium]